MHTTYSDAKIQQKAIISQLQTSDSDGFFNLLTSDVLFDKVESLLPDHRERQFPPTQTLAMFITQALSSDRSCQNIVNQLAVQRVANGLPSSSTHTGAYCRARQRLPLEMVSELAIHLGQSMDDLAPSQWRWRNRKIRIVDGTSVTMPDTVDNQSAYPQQKGQACGLGFPICRVVGITCLSSGALLNAAIGRFNGKGSDERALLRSIEDTFEKDDVILGDSFYSTYFFIAQMQAKEIDLVMEQNGSRKKTADFRCGKKLGVRDHLRELKKPQVKPDWMSDEDYSVAPESILIREVKVAGKILVTTMIDNKRVTKDDLKSLYRSRWNVELDIRHIKDTLGMNILSCKTPEMALKEIWVYILGYNLIRLLMAQSALSTRRQPRTLSFKHCLQLWIYWNARLPVFNDIQLYMLFELMSQKYVGNRPNRIEPRAVKRRPKAYSLLMKPRVRAREEVKKNGHPQKLK